MHKVELVPPRMPRPNLRCRRVSRTCCGREREDKHRLFRRMNRRYIKLVERHAQNDIE